MCTQLGSVLFLLTSFVKHYLTLFLLFSSSLRLFLRHSIFVQTTQSNRGLGLSGIVIKNDLRYEERGEIETKIQDRQMVRNERSWGINSTVINRMELHSAAPGAKLVSSRRKQDAARQNDPPVAHIVMRECGLKKSNPARYRLNVCLQLSGRYLCT